MGNLLSRRSTYRIVPRDPQYDRIGAAAAAQAYSVADSAQKIVDHSAAPDPHGDRAWGSAQFVPLSYFDGNGQLATSRIPAVAISDVFPASSETEMRGLNAQRGDMAIRTDQGRTYVLRTDDPTNINNWVELSSAGQVLSVNGQRGVIVLTAADVGAAPATHATNHRPGGPDSIADQYVGWYTVGQSGGVERYGASTTAVTTHAQATDPHGDRAFATSSISTAISNHLAQTDPHGSRAWVTSTYGSRVLPAGGTTGQALIKTGAGDYAVGWGTVASGGGGTTTPNGVINVRDYGVVADGTTDDSTAIQNALNATPAGGECLIPPGRYAVAKPLVVPPQVTFRARHSQTLWYTGSTPIPCVLIPLPSFTGAAVIRLLGKTAGGYATTTVGQRVRDITISGEIGPAPAGVKGVQLFGFVREATIERVTVRKMTDNGFAVDPDTNVTAGTNDELSQTGQSLRFDGCVSHNCTGAGFSLTNCPDTTFYDCNAQGNGWHGFYIAGMPNGQMIACRSEWSGASGYAIVSGQWSNGRGSGGMQMFGCMSDRNNNNGVLVEALGAGQIQIAAHTGRRDGRNNGNAGGNFAAIQVNGATMPVLVDGIAVYPGVNDDAANTTGGNSPQFGIRATNATYVGVAGASYIHAAQAPFSDGGGNTVFYRSGSIGTAIGTTDVVTRSAPQAPLVPNAPIDQPYAAAITPNAQAGNYRTTTATGNFTLNPPANPSDGQLWRYRFVAQGAQVVMTLGTGWRKPAALPTTLTVPQARRGDFMAVYEAADAAWTVLSMAAQQAATT